MKYLIKTPPKYHIKKTEENFVIYSVRLPRQLRVKPPDWRDLAYDHNNVEKLVYRCVKDNFRSSDLIFEPINEDFINNLKNILSIALKDLSSVLDLISVEINMNEQESDQLEVIVIFDHKNGETKQYLIPFNQYGADI